MIAWPIAPPAPVTTATVSRRSVQGVLAAAMRRLSLSLCCPFGVCSRAGRNAVASDRYDDLLDFGELEYGFVSQITPDVGTTLPRAAWDGAYPKEVL